MYSCMYVRTYVCVDIDRNLRLESCISTCQCMYQYLALEISVILHNLCIRGHQTIVNSFKVSHNVNNDDFIDVTM